MKIGYVLDSWPRFSETFLLKEINLLITAGHEVVVFSKNSSKKTVDGIGVHSGGRPLLGFLGHLKSSCRLIKLEMRSGLPFIKALKRALKNSYFFEEKVDVLVFTYAYQYPERKNVVGLLKSKSLVWLRGRDVLVFPFMGPVNYLPQLASADFILSRNYHLTRVLLENTGSLDVTNLLLPPPVELKNNLSLNQLNTPLKLLAVSRLYYYKGLTTTIDALSLIKDDDIRLTIVGDGPHKMELMSYAKKRGVGHRTDFVGPKSHKETLTLIDSHDTLIHSSLIEGCSNSVLEAMSAGKICIVAESPGNVVIDQETGLTFPPYNNEKLADIISNLKENKIVPDLIKNARNYVEKNHSEEGFNTMYLNTITSLV